MRLMRLLGVFCLAFCAAALARAEPAGKVLSADGDALVLRGSQILRLSRGAAVESGDQIHTGADSKILIVFTDSGLVWIRANSDFIIDEYSYAQSGRESAFFSLLKGGVRSVTGLIGRRTRSNFRLRLAIATIGIRGTDFSVVMCQRDCRDSDGSLADKGLYGEVLEGRIAVTPLDDRLAEREFSAGEFFHLADEHSTPAPLFLPPPFLRNKADEQTRAMEQLGIAPGPRNSGGATNGVLTGNPAGGLTGALTGLTGTLTTGLTGTVRGGLTGTLTNGLAGIFRTSSNGSATGTLIGTVNGTLQAVPTISSAISSSVGDVTGLLVGVADNPQMALPTLTSGLTQIAQPVLGPVLNGGPTPVPLPNVGPTPPAPAPLPPIGSPTPPPSVPLPPIVSPTPPPIVTIGTPVAQPIPLPSLPTTTLPTLPKVKL